MPRESDMSRQVRQLLGGPMKSDPEPEPEHPLPPQPEHPSPPQSSTASSPPQAGQATGAHPPRMPHRPGLFSPSPEVLRPIPALPAAPAAEATNPPPPAQEQPATPPENPDDNDVKPDKPKEISSTFSEVASSPALQSLLLGLANAQQTQVHRFHLVVLPEDDYPRIERFDDVQALLDRIQALVDTEVSLFPFLGTYMPITKGPNRFLMTSLGPMPLFKLPTADQVELEAHGYVGPKSTELEIPKPVGDDEQKQSPHSLRRQARQASAQPEAKSVDDTPVLPSVDES